MIKRTKHLTEKRALEILQLRFGTQVCDISKIAGTNRFLINNSTRPIFVIGIGEKNIFTREEILLYEDEMYKQFNA